MPTQASARRRRFKRATVATAAAQSEPMMPPKLSQSITSNNDICMGNTLF